MRTRALTFSVGILTVSLALAGCAANSSSQSMAGMNHDMSTMSGSSTFNPADAMFVTMMIPHHLQAVEMADMVLSKSNIDPRVTGLAQQIKAAQTPEIETMKGWLSDWGMPWDDSMATGMAGMDGMDHGDGMMSASDMDALKAAEGVDASRLFLEQMIRHHQGAIDMANSVISSGSNPDAIALAKRIVEAQTAEIASMQGILSSL